ncbi:MAG: putative glycoside hydrolase [Nitrospirae bacterium]|nr:putative glycoside hydrolase [Nitrospirota bacterium]
MRESGPDRAHVLSALLAGGLAMALFAAPFFLTGFPGNSKSGGWWSSKDLALAMTETGMDASARLYPVDLRVQKPSVKGIHITSWVAGSSGRFSQLVDLMDQTELNTAVIDLKEADGRIAYVANIPLAGEIGSIEKRIRDLDHLIRTLSDHHIYKIARIVVFKDTYLAEHRPDLALKSRSNGNIWRDFKGDAFSNPYEKAVWDYNIRLAEDAARRGFDEIQFDYIRFPSDGILSDILYPENHNEAEAMRIVGGFVAHAKDRLSSYNVALSVDVFGLTTVRDDVGIGQNFKTLSHQVDIVSPMIYPSHYWKGSYGFKNPNGAPYEIINRALKDAVKKASDETHPPEVVKKKIRPWLQDFTLGPPAYGPEEVRRQIQAAYDNGIDEWLLWNPGVRYTRTALEPFDAQVAAITSDGKITHGDAGNHPPPGNPNGTQEGSPCPPDCL